jgi:hypothetical protein
MSFDCYSKTIEDDVWKLCMFDAAMDILLEDASGDRTTGNAYYRAT